MGGRCCWRNLVGMPVAPIRVDVGVYIICCKGRNMAQASALHSLRLPQLLQTGRPPHGLVGFNQSGSPRAISFIPRPHHQLLQILPTQLVSVRLLYSRPPSAVSSPAPPSCASKAELYGFHTAYLTQYPR